MSLPAKRKPLRSGIERAPRRIWNKHRRFVRSHECVCQIHGDLEFVRCDGPIEFSHIRTAANSGTGLKPGDWSAVSMCQLHHRCYHEIGHESFEARYFLNLTKIAAEFVRKSPDTQMKLAMAA